MPITKLPKVGFWSDLKTGSSGWGPNRNYNSNRMEQLISVSILGEVATSTALPASPSNGDTYYVQDTTFLATYYIFTGQPGQWFQDFTPTGLVIYNSTTDIFYYFDGTAIQPLPTGSGGLGDFVGPAGAVDENIVVFDGVTGKLGKDGGQSIADLLALISAGGATQSQTTVFTANGTWTKATLNPLFVRVTVVGGGGGGGGANDVAASGEVTASGGGGGGGCAIKTILAGALGATETVTVGQGGNGGSTGGGDGSNGTASSFGAHCSGSAGGGGDGDTTGTTTSGFQPGGTGGIGSNGDVNFRGSDAGPGVVCGSDPVCGGYGGASYLGGSAAYINSADGKNGMQYGGGGSGTLSTSTVFNFSGGDGADGIVIVEEYF